MKILIVDDDFESRKLLQKMLHDYGYVEIATDGEEGVEAFRAAMKEGEPYNLVCMDILMPNMNGQQALREMREVEREKGVEPKDAAKVIMISGLDDDQELHDAFFLGDATAYIVKPIRRSVLLEEIKSLGLHLEKTS